MNKNAYKAAIQKTPIMKKKDDDFQFSLEQRNALKRLFKITYFWQKFFKKAERTEAKEAAFSYVKNLEPSSLSLEDQLFDAYLEGYKKGGEG